MTRRAVLTGAALLGVGAGVERLAAGALSSAPPEQAADAVIPFHGQHQAGIATPQQRYLSFASFDVNATSRATLRDLLRRLTAAAAALTAGGEYSGRIADPGEAVGLPTARLTMTFGFGPELFGSPGRDRFGLAAARPPALEPLPAFPGDMIDPASSGGDLCVQACADEQQVAFHAVHVLAAAAASDATLRWVQHGFVAAPARAGETGRNLIGFKDGTNNIKPSDSAALDQFVWARSPRWLNGGTYLVARRIQIVFPGWDDLSVGEQERAIGRHKLSGAPLGTHREHDPVNLLATDARGNPVIPLDAHVRITNPQSNGGRRILRRGYGFSSGITAGSLDQGGHQLDAGLFFIALARDPRRQIIPLLRRVSSRDALSTFTVHTASAIFALPAGVRPGGFIGDELLG